MALRVVTLNSWKGDGAYAARLTAIIQGLDELAPDVVLLQESLLAPALGADTGGPLAMRLGLAHHFLPLRRKPREVEGRWADSWSGLSILSRLPLRSVRRLDLPADPRDGERAALAAELDWGGMSLTVVNLHLTHLTDADGLRRGQLAAATAGLRLVLVGGDFNAAPDALPLADLGLTDLRADCGAPLLPTCGGSCLDHWLRGADTPLRARRVEPVLGPVAGRIAASDHLGLMADLELAP